MTTGASDEGESPCLSSWQTEMPSILGNITSRTTRSKGLAAPRRLSIAFSPSETETVSIPSRESACSITSLTARSSSTMRTLVIRNLRQSYFDGRPFPFFGFQTDLSSHPLDQFLADGQTQAEAFRVAPSVEALEQVGHVLLAYSRPLVLNGDAGSFGPQPDASAFLRVLESVAHEHEQRLLKPFLVGPDSPSCALYREIQRRTVGKGPHALGDPRSHLDEVDLTDLRVPAIPSSLGELEQRLRETLHPFCLGTDVRQKALPHPRIVVPFRKQQFRSAEDRRDWGLELVGGVGQEALLVRLQAPGLREVPYDDQYAAPVLIEGRHVLQVDLEERLPTPHPGLTALVLLRASGDGIGQVEVLPGIGQFLWLPDVAYPFGFHAEQPAGHRVGEHHLPFQVGREHTLAEVFQNGVESLLAFLETAEGVLKSGGHRVERPG